MDFDGHSGGDRDERWRSCLADVVVVGGGGWLVVEMRCERGVWWEMSKWSITR